MKNAAGSAIAVAATCANCGNDTACADCVPGSSGVLCCSAACAILSDELSDPLSDELEGLEFCSPACRQLYPKALGSPELRPLLAGAAVGVLAFTACLLAYIVYWFKHAGN